MGIESVFPVSDKHSIKEVVISLFLTNPISNPDKTREILKSSFKNRFDRYDPVSNFQVQFHKNNNNVQAQFNLDQGSGFKFVKHNEGKAVLILQGINEPTRSYISYHSLDYPGWESFLDTFKSIISMTAQHLGDLSIK